MDDVETIVRYLRKWRLKVSRTHRGFMTGCPEIYRNGLTFAHESPLTPYPRVDLLRGAIFMPGDAYWKDFSGFAAYTLLHEGAHLLASPQSIHANEDGAMLAFEAASAAWLQGRGAAISTSEWVKWRVSTGAGENLNGIMRHFSDRFPEIVDQGLFTRDGAPTFKKWRPHWQVTERDRNIRKSLKLAARAS